MNGARHEVRQTTFGTDDTRWHQPVCSCDWTGPLRRTGPDTDGPGHVAAMRRETVQRRLSMVLNSTLAGALGATYVLVNITHEYAGLWTALVPNRW